MHKLVYTDEQDLRIYESLPSTDFKEFFMAYFKYKKGDKVELTDFTNPVTFALFNSYIPKLDKNEDTYNKKVQASKENGKKGGRPKKSVITEVENNEFELPNCQISNTAHLSPSNNKEVEQPQPTVDNTTEATKTTIEENFTTDEEKYGIDVVDLIDENPEIINALNVVVEYRCGDHSKLMEAQGANSKIESIVKSKSLDADFNSRVERFCADYIKQYTEYVINNVKVKQIA